MIIDWFLASLLSVPALAIFLSLLIWKRDSAFIITSMSSLPGLFALPMVLIYGEISVAAPFDSIFGNYYLNLNLLGAIFISLSSAVYFVTVLHLSSHISRERSIYHPAILSAFYLACVTAFLADDVILLLISWEGISLFSFLLSDFTGKARKEAWRYLVITHLGGLMIMASLLYLFFISGETQISSWYDLNLGIDSSTGSILVLLLILGFGTKLGLMPFQVWMSGLYDRAPPHAVTLMAAVSTNVAVFLLIRLIFSFMDFTESTVALALVVMFLASVTAIWGALQALVQDAPMKVLAFSSMKNMALVVLMLGLSMLFASHGAVIASALALITALFHTLNHSVFKSLSILGLYETKMSTEEDRFQKLGGLAVTSPAISILMLVGVLSMAALPPFNGFISEWMMVQSMMEAFALGVEPYRIALPLGVAVLGLSGALGVASYVRLYGFVFLGRPRSNGAKEPKPVKRSSLIILSLLGISCIGLGLFSIVAIGLLSNAVSQMVGTNMDITLSPPFTLGMIDPLVVGIALLALTLLIIGLMKLRPSEIYRSRTWDCGTDLDSDMQYSASAFSQPLVKVFQTTYRPITNLHGSKEIEREIYPDPFWQVIYLPLSSNFRRFSKYIGRIQGGSMQSYLAYLLALLLVMMVVLR